MYVYVLSCASSIVIAQFLRAFSVVNANGSLLLHVVIVKTFPALVFVVAESFLGLKVASKKTLHA